MNTKQYILIGITGGIASGKSVVSTELKRMGAYVIDADLIAREIVQPDMPAWRDIKEAFGNDVVRKDRTIDRKKLGRIIFNDPEKKKLLERITHPEIIKEQQKIIQRLIKKGYKGIIAVDAALLIESEYYREMDKVVVVYAAREVQLKRLMQRDKISKKEAENKADAQMPMEEKKKYADFVIMNNDSLDDVKEQARMIYNALKAKLND